MRYSNEFKVGASIILAAVIFFFGVRFFQDLPIFSGTYALYTDFGDVKGLIGGSSVTVNGVRVGAVDQVSLVEDAQRVAVTFHVEDGMELPVGSYTEIRGFEALGDVSLSIVPRRTGAGMLVEGARLPSREDDLLTSLSDRAPGLVDRVDTLLMGANRAFNNIDPTLNAAESAMRGLDRTVTQVGGQAGQTLDELNRQLYAADGDLRRTLAGLRQASESLSVLMQAEQERLDRVLANVEGATASLDTFGKSRGDSLALAVDNLNAVLRRLNTGLASLESTSTGVDSLLARIDQGEGSLGLLINDPALYHEIVGLTTNLNALIDDLQENPGRYLKELELIDIF